MVKITADQIKKLRLMTKVGVMDCRKALQESNGDFAKAQNWLLKKGAALADKKKDRATKSGIIESYIHAGGGIGVLVKLSCETDFVAKNEDFKNLAHELAMQVAAMNPKNIKELLEQEYIRDPKKKTGDLLTEVIGKIRENIKVGRIARFELGE